MDKLTDLWGGGLLQNDFQNTLCEIISPGNIFRVRMKDSIDVGSCHQNNQGSHVLSRSGIGAVWLLESFNGWMRAGALTCRLISLVGVKWSCLLTQAIPPCKTRNWSRFGPTGLFPRPCDVLFSFVLSLQVLAGPRAFS